MGVQHLPVETVNSAPVTVIKAPSDDREYEVLRLSNGIVALLIHDPHIELANGGDRKGEKRPLESAEEEGEDEEDEITEDEDDDSDYTSSVTEDGHVHVHGEHCTHELHEHGDCDGDVISDLDDEEDEDESAGVAHGGAGNMAPTKKVGYWHLPVLPWSLLRIVETTELP